MKYLSMIRVIILIVIGIGVVMVFVRPSSTTNAARRAPTSGYDTPTPTPEPTPVESEELRRLKERNAVLAEQQKAAEHEKAIAVAKQAELAAKFPKPTTTPLAGNATIDQGVRIESQMMTYKALRTVANGIAVDVTGKQSGINTLAVFNTQSVKSIQSYSATMNQLGLMQNGYGNVLQSTPASASNPALLPAAITMANSVLGAFVDLIALLRTDTSVTGNSYTVEESILVAEVYRSLKTQHPTTSFYYPAEFPPNISAQTEFEILKRIEELNIQKISADELIAAIEETEKKLKEEVGAKEKLEARKNQLPKDVIAAGEELAKNEKIYKKFKSAELLAKIEDGKAAIKKLEKERDVDVPKALATSAESIAALELKLTSLDSAIGVAVDSQLIGQGYTQMSGILDQTGKRFLGTNAAPRAYTIAEISALAKGEKTTRDKLIAEAVARRGSPLSSAEIDKLWNPLDTHRLQIYVKVDKNKPKPLNEYLTELEQLRVAYATEAEVAVEKKRLDRRRSASLVTLKALNAQFQKFYDDIIKVDAATGVNPITMYLQAESLMFAMGCDPDDGCDNAFMLEMRVVSAGGNNRIKKNLITNVFTGADISHSGGAIVEYKLYDLTGKVAASSVCFAYEDYRRAGSIMVHARPADNIRTTHAACGSSTQQNEAGK